MCAGCARSRSARCSRRCASDVCAALLPRTLRESARYAANVLQRAFCTCYAYAMRPTLLCGQASYVRRHDCRFLASTTPAARFRLLRYVTAPPGARAMGLARRPCRACLASCALPARRAVASQACSRCKHPAPPPPRNQRGRTRRCASKITVRAAIRVRALTVPQRPCVPRRERPTARPLDSAEFGRASRQRIKRTRPLAGPPDASSVVPYIMVVSAAA